MSEGKSLTLISFGTQKVSELNSKESNKTVRISVILPESTEDKCPEFNYKDELVAAKTKPDVKTSMPKPTNGLDPFNEDDDDVKRIAAEMEAKYGMGVAKKRKWRKDDYADIGMGYDESDSFIDNTDGYDEIIPKNVTTVHGGFYINCGALEFKTDEAVSSDDSSSSDEEVQDKSDSRKRKLESSAESEEDTPPERNGTESTTPSVTEKKPKLMNNANGMQKAIKKRLFGHEKLKQQMRKKRLDDSAKKTVSQLLREKRIDLNMTVESVNEDPIEIEVESSSPNENKKPPTLASVDDVIESVISNAVVQNVHVDESSKESVAKSTPPVLKLAVNSSPSDAESNDGLSIRPTEIVKLPENLPSDIISIIDSIKTAAACSTEGKVKFFTDNVNGMLLNLERKCRCLGKHSRMKVYEHLAPFVKCRKETLIKRAKNLCMIEEQKKIKVLLDSLKKTIDMMMPSIIRNYEDECKAVVNRKFSPNSDEHTKYLRQPKKHFSWTEDLKKLLRDIVNLRRKCYINEGKQKETLDILLVEFLKTEIHTIWPDGWVSMNSLIKHSNIVDPKKNVDSIKKSIPSSSPEVNINPPPNISVTPTAAPAKTTSSNITINPTSNIPISASSALTITPVTTPPPPTLTPHKVTSSDKVKPKHPVGDTVISKISNDTPSISKTSRSLPPADIVKTPSTTSVKYTAGANNLSHIVHNSLKEVDTILIDEPSLKKEEPEDLSSHHTIVDKHLENVIKDGLSRSNFQIIDLTDHSDYKKKLASKSKPKYVYDYQEKIPKQKLEPVETIRVKSQEELTGSLALTQLIADSLNNDSNRFTKSNVISKTSNSVINSTSSHNNINSSTFEYPKSRTVSDGDDIQKVMEGLKVLQKMSSPVKSHEDARTSSPVSVIAFNKSFSQDATAKTTASTPTTPRSNSFQDAFQKHFLPDFTKASFAASTSKGSYNSYNKHNHAMPRSSAPSGEKVVQNPSNFSQQASNKLKSNYSSQQSGSYNMLDDMFTNFLSEYGHSKTANSKSSSQHK
uniref:Ubinuclein middle domain-containing protein n=1 Tax=Photinus pyralis TaxID=7054 RepID=A0A1Y1NBZ8_PHOPY